MICNRCGNNCEPGMQFCNKCGNALPPQQQNTYSQPYYGGGYSSGPTPSTPGKGLGIASMVCGIVAIVLFCIWYLSIPCAIVSVIMGAVSISKAKEAGMKNGMATAGIVCSVISLALVILFIIIVAAGVATGLGTMNLYY